jgi:acyl carrier protein
MSKSISKKEIFKIIAKSLNVPEKKINEKVSSNNFEEWDSMSHLNILIALDKKLENKAQKIQELSETYSVKKIIQILVKEKLFK